MKGYTIEKSIDLLEKDVQALKQGGGGGGASSWSQLQNKPFNTLGEEFYNLDGALTLDTVSADKVALPESTQYTWDYLPQAIEALAEDSNHFSDDIAELESSKQDRLTYQRVEFDTGKKWVDGRTIYGRLYDGLVAQTPAGTIVSISDAVPGMDYIVSNSTLFKTGGGDLVVTNQYELLNNNTDGLAIRYAGTYTRFISFVYIEYVKVQ